MTSPTMGFSADLQYKDEFSSVERASQTGSIWLSPWQSHPTQINECYKLCRFNRGVKEEERCSERVGFSEPLHCLLERLSGTVRVAENL